MARVELLAQGATREGYTLLVMAEGKKNARRFWWACGGCWCRSEPAKVRKEVQSHAETHLFWCSVHGSDSPESAWQCPQASNPGGTGQASPT